MKKYLLISPGYPSTSDRYNNGFVHQRVLEYINQGLNIKVFSFDKKCTKNYDYEYECVNITVGYKKDLENLLMNQKYEKIFIHFGWKEIMQIVLKKAPSTNIILWVHGVEALSCHRRLFNLRFSIISVIKFLGYIYYNTIQMNYMRTLINNNKEQIHFVFVSKWMKEILEKDTKTQNKIINYSIIPNIINEKIFIYNEKDIENRFNIFNIRTYDSKKYANDIMVKSILELSKAENFQNITFNIYGDGRLFDKTLKSIKKFNNVNIRKGFLSQNEIASIHKNNGILLMPTRQDAQGVSMCEAMSSGLVPVVSNNTAIPEYVNEDCGYLCRDYKEMAESIKFLINNPDIFKEKSRKASEYIQKKCARNIIIKKELEIILE